jgi:hypothetical protein
MIWKKFKNYPVKQPNPVFIVDAEEIKATDTPLMNTAAHQA